MRRYGEHRAWSIDHPCSYPQWFVQTTMFRLTLKLCLSLLVIQAISFSLYPQLDEYESTATVSGLWSLDPRSGELVMLTHSPSGDFTPIVDSFGRIVFTRWDHLKRDQQADADFVAGGQSTINWPDESATSTPSIDRGSNAEIFLEICYAYL